MKVRKLIAFIVSLSLVILFIGCWPNRKTNPRALLFANLSLSSLSVTLVSGTSTWKTHLAATVFNSACDFDAEFGAGAHSYSAKMREKFYDKLKNDIKNEKNTEGDARYRFRDEANFAEDFEDSFGDLPDTDNDDIPDVVDDDDDNDGVPDTRDDDDDNDGCLDRDEADDNLGGHTDELTGEGRGEGRDPGEKVDKDDPNFDPPPGID